MVITTCSFWFGATLVMPRAFSWLRDHFWYLVVLRGPLGMSWMGLGQPHERQVPNLLDCNVFFSTYGGAQGFVLALQLGNMISGGVQGIQQDAEDQTQVICIQLHSPCIITATTFPIQEGKEYGTWSEQNICWWWASSGQGNSTFPVT